MLFGKASVFTLEELNCVNVILSPSAALNFSTTVTFCGSTNGPTDLCSTFRISSPAGPLSTQGVRQLMAMWCYHAGCDCARGIV